MKSFKIRKVIFGRGLSVARKGMGRRHTKVWTSDGKGMEFGWHEQQETRFLKETEFLAAIGGQGKLDKRLVDALEYS